MMLDIISGIGLSILGLMAAYATVYINRAAIKVRARNGTNQRPTTERFDLDGYLKA